MKKKQCTLRILDEVNCVFIGLNPLDIKELDKKYAILTDNYFFNPKYKLGPWDGRIHFFSKTCKTYVHLLDDIIPRIVNFGYNINIDDLRRTPSVTPKLIDENYFKDRGVLHPITGEPWVIRDYQVEMVNTLLEHNGGVALAGTGSGKDQPLYSAILTPNGWKTMGDMAVGDTVITPSGDISNIIGVYPQGIRDVYEITFHDGSKTRCGLNHLWKVWYPVKQSTSKTSLKIVTTKDIIEFLSKREQNIIKRGNISIPLISGIEKQKQEYNIDPYLLGTLIGDGMLSTSIRISSSDNFILEQVLNLTKRFNVSLKHNSNYDYRITKDVNNRKPNLLIEELKNINLFNKKSNNKFIPEIYKEGSIEQRWELIRGLMDTDGYVDETGKTIAFTTISLQLSKDFQDIIWSLGGTCTITSKYPTYTYKGEKRTGQLAYTCYAKHQYPSLFFKLPRKKERCRQEFDNGRTTLNRRITSVKLVDTTQTQCIKIDHPDELYITDDYVVTHNTSVTALIALAYEEVANYRSIIIVPDKNLTVQTFVEYANFGLDVGQYGGGVKDGDHQHVVSTWQTLQNHPTFIQQFQVIIVDEAHGLKGKVLQELLTKYGKDIPFRFGVTGTIPKSKTDAMSVNIAVGPILYEIPAHELQEAGHLADLHIDIMQHELDFTEKYQEYLDTTDETPVTYKKFIDEFFPDYSAEKHYLQQNKLRTQWIADYIQTQHILGLGNVLCLVNGIAFGKKLAELIPGSTFLSGKDHIKVRRKAYALFNDRNDVTVIATVNIASTGLDIPRIFQLIGIDMGKSFIRVIQSIGRGLRKAVDKDKVTYTDICSNLKYSRRHLTERKKYFKEAKYKFKLHKVELKK